MGCGEAKSKKDAQGKAAEMFCNLLVENGLVDRKELPSGGGGEHTNTGTPPGSTLPLLRPPPPPQQLQSNFQQQSFRPGKDYMYTKWFLAMAVSVYMSSQLNHVIMAVLPPSPLPPWPLAPARLPPLASLWSPTMEVSFILCP